MDLYDLSRRHDVTPELTRQISKLRGYVREVSLTLPVPYPACSRRALLTTSSWLRRDRVRGERWKGCWKKSWKCLGLWRGSEENHMHTTMRFLGMAFWFWILFYLGGVRWETAPNKLKDEETNTALCLQNRDSSVLCWPLPLPLPESGMAVPATLVSGLACFPRARRARETQKRA